MFQNNVFKHIVLFQLYHSTILFGSTYFYEKINPAIGSLFRS